MEEKVMQEIKEYLMEKLQSDFGYCGIAEGTNFMMINTGKEKDLIIEIKIKEE